MHLLYFIAADIQYFIKMIMAMKKEGKFTMLDAIPLVQLLGIANTNQCLFFL